MRTSTQNFQSQKHAQKHFQRLAAGILMLVAWLVVELGLIAFSGVAGARSTQEEAASTKTSSVKPETSSKSGRTRSGLAARTQSPAAPKLILALVVDQFRSDALFHWQDRFTAHGYNLLLEKGAVYPFAQYPVLQNMTCPGHAMILTGSVPAQNGIALNQWFNAASKKHVYCVEDPEFGISPRALRGSTLGDEMKLRWPESKVVGVSFKDRAAVMLAGHGANAAYWYDEENFRWGSSSYYKGISNKMKAFHAPHGLKKDEEFKWASNFGSRKFEKSLKWGSPQSFASQASLDETFAAAKAAIEAHELGHGTTPDLLGLSLSTHDYVGHTYGPNSPEIEEITLAEDHALDEFFSYLDKQIPGGLKNVWILFTADHGAAPTVEEAKSVGLDAGRIDYKTRIKELNARLKDIFGVCKSGDWIAGYDSFHLYFDIDCALSLGARHSELYAATKTFILRWEGVADVFTRVDAENNFYPPRFEKQIKASYFPPTSGDLIIIPKPFWYELSGAPATHITSYVYDRTVPMIFVGSPFKSGIYSDHALVTDAAPTLAHVLRINAPALSEGQVLGEILKEPGVRSLRSAPEQLKSTVIQGKIRGR